MLVVVAGAQKMEPLAQVALVVEALVVIQPRLGGLLVQPIEAAVAAVAAAVALEAMAATAALAL